MRMRKKPNLVPRMERCAATLITDPEALRGHWLEHFPGYQALQLNSAAARAASRQTLQHKTRIFSSPRSKKCRTPWSSAWSV